MSFRRVVSLLLLAAYLPACTGFQATSQPLSELTAPPAPVQQLRVTTKDGKRTTVLSPTVVSDTLRGFAGSRSTDIVVILIPVADIASVEVGKPKDDATSIIVIVIVGAVIGGLVVAMCGGDSWAC